MENYDVEHEENLENEENIKELFLKNRESEGIGNNENFSNRNFVRRNTGELPVAQYNFKEKSKMITKLFGRISNV